MIEESLFRIGLNWGMWGDLPMGLAIALLISVARLQRYAEIRFQPLSLCEPAVQRDTDFCVFRLFR